MISIITINYNNASGLRRTLKSIAEQKAQDYEVIIIDGASLDDSHIKYIEVRNDKMKWFSSPDNGIYDAMNKGLEKIKGDYFMFVNSGDLLANNTVITNYSDIIEHNHPKPQIIYSGVTFFNVENFEIERFWQPSNFKRWKLLLGWMPPHPGFTISTNYFRKINTEFDSKYNIAADYGFMLKYLLKTDPSKVVRLNNISVSMENGGISNNNIKSVISANLQVLKIWKEHIGFYPAWILVFKPFSKIIQLRKKNG